MPNTSDLQIDLTPTPANIALAQTVTAADFTVNSDGREFPFVFDDEAHTGYFGYGHTDKTAFADAVNDYELHLDRLIFGPNYQPEPTTDPDEAAFTADQVQHSWVAITESPTNEDPWWMTVVDAPAANTVPITWIEL